MRNPLKNSLKNPIEERDGNGKRWIGRLNFPLAECIASSGLLMIAASVAIAVTPSSPMVLLPGISYAIAIGLAYAFYRHFQSVRPDTAETANAASVATNRPFRMDVHPLLESGWEDDLATESPEWVDMTAATFFKVVGTRGTCPRGLTEGDFLRAGSDGSISPALCAEAEAVLRMAAGVDIDVKQWCCPIYDHMLVFKKQEKSS